MAILSTQVMRNQAPGWFYLKLLSVVQSRCAARRDACIFAILLRSRGDSSRVLCSPRAHQDQGYILYTSSTYSEYTCSRLKADESPLAQMTNASHDAGTMVLGGIPTGTCVHTSDGPLVQNLVKKCHSVQTPTFSHFLPLSPDYRVNWNQRTFPVNIMQKN